MHLFVLKLQAPQKRITLQEAAGLVGLDSITAGLQGFQTFNFEMNH